MSDSVTSFIELVQRTRAGEAAAYGELWERLNLLVGRWKRLAPDLPENGASDVGQETLLVVFTRLDSSTGDTDLQFISWVRKIHRTQGVNALRRYQAQRRDRGRQQPLDKVDGAQLAGKEATPSKNVSHKELQGHVREGLESLSEDDQELFTLRYYDNMPFRDIARLLGIREEAARRRAVRCRQRLAQTLPESYRGGES